jgi:hypothetical protein
MVSNARHFWSQPVFFIASIWSVVLARGNVSRSGLYMGLGQAVAILFAMNLSFIAMLQEAGEDVAISKATDTALAPSSKAIKEAESQRGVTTKPRLSYKPPASRESLLTPMLFLILLYICITLFQQSAGTKWFMPRLAVPHIMLLLLPMVQRSSKSDQTLRSKDKKTI